MFRLRLSRTLLPALAPVLALSLLPAAPAVAAAPSDPAVGAVRGSGDPTPHLDAVERALREVSPGLEGRVWERTSGNRLAGTAAEPSGWLLQTPGCWGDPACADRPGTRRLLTKMTEDIARAEHTVDISTLAPFPDGAFQDAIVAGLKASVAAGHRPKVRVLAGAAPVYHLNVVPAKWRDEVVAKLGTAAGSVALTVASMTTSKTGLSWNHSKLLVVDGRYAVTGGINNWKGDYLDTAHPVADVDLALAGPAAGSASRYLDALWEWTCRNRNSFTSVWFAASEGAACTPSLADTVPTADRAPAEGDLSVLAVGGLGIGIADRDPLSGFRPALPSAAEARCGIAALPDRTNADRDYDTVNPEESALRALVGSAVERIDISQQDMNATCPPLPRYDIRLYDLLAAKLAAGVKVRIVVSDPANRGAVGSGGYSQIKSLAEISDLLRDRLTRLTGDRATARATMCSGLQLAPFRAAATPVWADGHAYAQHHKLVSVDGAAFTIGSKNLYPAWLQDFGYVVEDRAAADRLKRELLDPQWTFSGPAATVDWEKGVCPAA
ncbi:phospholipase [Streptomyces sp. NPDC097619]|uniref:phospholipase n=1 Tax=Streptomyces sp. NPDC097619 TaxID=3157228 RepID=UPI00331F8404